jgi:hypothetical protein
MTLRVREGQTQFVFPQAARQAQENKVVNCAGSAFRQKSLKNRVDSRCADA